MPKRLCLRCGSEKLDDADVFGYRPQLVSRKAKKTLGIVWSTGSYPKRAEVCLGCGFVSFLVDLEKYRKVVKDSSTRSK
jgi:hypothetical protein